MTPSKSQSSLSATQTQDVQIVKTHDVSCDGGKGALGHPRVYLHIRPQEQQISCPYCGKIFQYKD